MKSITSKVLTFLFVFGADVAWMAEDKSNLDIGESYLQNKDYAKAAIYFELALQNPQDEKSLTEGLYKLGNCYLEIAKESAQNEKVQNDLFEKTELIFMKLRDLDKSERTQLALARTYILHGSHLHNNEALEKGKALVTESDYSKLLLALASTSYTDRKKYYSQIIDASNQTNRWYALSWYLLGLNELEQDDGHLFEAVHAFEKAYSLLYPNDIPLAALCLKYKAEAYARQSSKEGYLQGLSELNHLIQLNQGELLANLEDPGEIYYLRGLISARLYFEGAGSPFGDIAEKSFIEGLKNTSKGKYVPETKKMLGILYFKQQKFNEATEVFEKLVKTYSMSPEAAESLLWLSLYADEEKGRMYLKKLYTDYPLSSYADEAYFRYYPFEEYLKGTAEAIEHLSQIQDKFPQSGYLVVAEHLLGHESKRRIDLETAADFFEKAEIAYEALPLEKKDNGYFKEIAYQSALERALVLLELERMDESEIILKRLVSSINDDEKISPLLEKAAYHLVNIYIKEQNDDEAEKLISRMLKMYERSKIEHGYYFSRLWYDRGMIALKENSPRQALQYFRHSELAAKGDILDKGQLLDLWIQQSLCHLELGEMDSSMQLLSRVANYNATSSLRVKAMYLRAEIYEKQGRHELAKKQLQATSTKGGEWALKAKQKLEKDYVHQQHSG